MDIPHSQFYIGEEPTHSRATINALLRVWAHKKLGKIFFFVESISFIFTDLQMHNIQVEYRGSMLKLYFLCYFPQFLLNN